MICCAYACADMDKEAALHPSIVAWAKCWGVDEKDAAVFFKMRKRLMIQRIAQEEPCEDDTPEEVAERQACKKLLEAESDDAQATAF